MNKYTESLLDSETHGVCDSSHFVAYIRDRLEKLELAQDECIEHLQPTLVLLHAESPSHLSLHGTSALKMIFEIGQYGFRDGQIRRDGCAPLLRYQTSLQQLLSFMKFFIEIGDKLEAGNCLRPETIQSKDLSLVNIAKINQSSKNGLEHLIKPVVDNFQIYLVEQKTRGNI